MAAVEKYDSALLGILQNEGQVAPFLDSIIGFLYRRTDFFRIMHADTDKLGFPPGVAFKLLVNIFKKYESMAAQDQQKKEVKKERDAQPKEVAGQTDHDQSLKTSDKNTSPETKSVELLNERCQDSSGQCTSSSPTATDNQTPKQESASASADMEQEKTETVTPSRNSEENECEEGAGEGDKEDPEQARLRRELQSNPLTYNGADCDSYLWSQSISEADIRVKVPDNIVKGKQVKVDIRKKKIAVSCQLGSAFSDLVSGELEWEVKAEDSMWTLSPGEFVHINLEKKQERWWERVFVGETGINTRKIDCSRPMTDLDDEAQAKIEEMMFNQRQKQLGLPQSHEVKTHDMLRKAWDAEGSPFKGQPFDPSKFSVDPSGTATFNPGDS